MCLKNPDVYYIYKFKKVEISAALPLEAARRASHLGFNHVDP